VQRAQASSSAVFITTHRAVSTWLPSLVAWQMNTTWEMQLHDYAQWVKVAHLDIEYSELTHDLHEVISGVQKALGWSRPGLAKLVMEAIISAKDHHHSVSNNGWDAVTAMYRDHAERPHRQPVPTVEICRMMTSLVDLPSHVLGSHRLSQWMTMACASMLPECIAACASKLPRAWPIAWRLAMPSGSHHLRKCSQAVGEALLEAAALSSVASQKQAAAAPYIVLQLGFKLTCPILERFARARMQLPHGSHRLIWWHTSADPQPDADVALLKSLFGEETVDLVTDELMEQVFDGFSMRSSHNATQAWTWPLTHGHGPDPTKIRLPWQFCDAIYLAWAQLHRPLLQGRQGVWVLESDMDWSGSLGQGLSPLDEHPAEYLGVLDCRRQPSSWPHIGKHDYAQGTVILSTLVQIVRLSTRLLLELGEVVRAGRRVYCETLACTHCALKGYRTGGLVELLPSSSKGPHEPNSTNTWRPIDCTPARTVDLSHTDTPFVLYHGCK